MIISGHGTIEHGGRGHPARRLRLHREAARDASACWCCVRNALELAAAAQREPDAAHRTAEKRYQMVGDAPGARTACAAPSQRAAPTNATVLITGRERHRQGAGRARDPPREPARRRAPFVQVNCAAIPDELIESELFGHEKGSLHRRRRESQIGKFELADGGTIFLDEIGDMSLKTQAKVLRVLQERRGRARRRATAPIKVDVRVIAATNKDLEEEIDEGTLPRGPLLPAQRHADSTCRRCASGARTSRRWSGTSRDAAVAREQLPAPHVRRRRRSSSSEAAALARQRARAAQRGRAAARS